MFLKNLNFVQKYLRSSSNGSKEYKHDLINQLNEKYSIPNKPKSPIKQNTSSSSAPIPIPKRKKLTFN